MCVVHGGQSCCATSAGARVCAYTIGYSSLARGFKVLLSSWLTVGADSSLGLCTHVFIFVQNLSPGNVC